MKILCVLLLHFPLCCEVLRQPSLKGKPILITYTDASQRLVLDCSPGLDGLQRDMPLQQALSHKGNANLVAADIPYYRSKFTELLEALENISPLVEGIEPGSIYIGVDGLQLIYPDNKDIIRAVFDIIPGIFTPRIGLATNKFLAYLAAINCPDGGHRVLDGGTTAFLQDLSCDLLPVSIKSRQKLHDFGLHKLGQLSELAIGPLLSQFGRDGKKLYNLARGWDDTPLNPSLMAEAIEESLTLPSVTVSLEAVIVALESLLVRVFKRIGQVGLGIYELNIWTRTWDAVQWEQTIRFKEPAMGIRGVVNRIKQRLENCPQRGPVEHLGLCVNRLGYPHGRQSNLLPEVRARDHLMEDIRQLELRLGNPQVYKLQEVEPWSRIPERRYVLAPTNR
jgi:DNA polymerase-4